MIIDNLIIIKGGVYNDIKKALGQWIRLYRKDLKDDLTFELYKGGQNNHVIKVDDRLCNELFFFLINYLRYPEGIEYKIKIEGYTTGRNDNFLKNKKLLVYVSSTDEEYDNVFVTTSENKNYKYDFGGKITEVKEKRNYKQPSDFTLERSEILNASEYLQKSEKVSFKKIEKRFKIISFIGLVLLLIAHVFYFVDIDIFIIFIFFIEMGLWTWFFSDYKMLQSDRHYIYCLLISIAFGGYGLFLKQFITFDNELAFLAVMGTLLPFLLLLIQKPTRLIYKSIYNTEPVVDKPAPTIDDAVYSLILLFVPMVLVFVIMLKLLK